MAVTGVLHSSGWQPAIRLRDVRLRLEVRPRLPRRSPRGRGTGGTTTVGGALATDRRRVLAVTALDNITVDIRVRQRVGLIGHNGAGKSSLLRTMAGIYHPTSGTCETRGRVSTLFTSMPESSQDATGLENIYRCGYTMGLGRKEIEDRIPEVIEWSGLGDYIHLPMRMYSRGMRTRLAASVAMHVDADILLVDEVIGQTDSRCREYLSRAIHTGAQTLVLASHSPSVILDLCDVVIWMDHGRIRAMGDAKKLLDEFQLLVRQRRSRRSTDSLKRPWPVYARRPPG